MANRATKSDCFQTAIIIEGPLHTQDRVEFDERQRGRWIIQINLPLLYLLNQVRGQRIQIHLQAHSKGGAGTDAGTAPAELAALDRLMKLQLVGPVRFIAKRVVAEDLLTLFQHSFSVVDDLVVKTLSGLVAI